MEEPLEVSVTNVEKIERLVSLIRERGAVGPRATTVRMVDKRGRAVVGRGT